MYCERSDLENIFGCHNVSSWADIENQDDADHITQRIAWAIATAGAMLNDDLNGGPYTIPFSATYPTQVIHYCAVKASILLYDSRGIREADPSKDVLQMHRKSYRDFVSGVLSNKVTLTGVTRVNDAKSFPNVVKDVEGADTSTVVYLED